MKYQCIADHRHEYPVRMMCRLFDVKPSGFYAWQARPPSQRSLENKQLRDRIVEIHTDSDGTYGSPRVRDELLDEGYRVGKHRIARLMRELALQGCPQKRYRVTTQSDHGFAVAPNHLNREFVAAAPNKRWAADITYIRTGEGWLYLAVVLDLYSKAVVGWSMSHRINRELVLQALLMALYQRRPDGDLMHHSDRGSQYASGDFQALLDDARYRMFDERRRQLLRQRRGRELLRVAEARTRSPASLSNPTGSQDRRVRLHRALLQSQASTRVSRKNESTQLRSNEA